MHVLIYEGLLCKHNALCVNVVNWWHYRAVIMTANFGFFLSNQSMVTCLLVEYKSFYLLLVIGSV